MPNFIERPRYSCALGGALATVTALPGAIPIMHATSGCAGNFTWAQSGAGGLQVGGLCGGLSVPSSNVQEREIVFGGTDRLTEQIRTTFEIMEGRLFVVLTSCVTDMIGDDVRRTVEELTTPELPVIAAETAGFKGNSYYGYDAVLQSIFRGFVEKTSKKIRKKVNLWGIVPTLDIFWRGNIEAIRSLLMKLGLDVNTFFSKDDSLDRIRAAASAELNIVVSDAYGVSAARVFEEEHGTPFITLPLPVGPSGTDEFLRKTGQALSISKTSVEKLVKAENDLFYRYLDPLTDPYNDFDLQRYAVVVGDCNYSYSLTRFLSDDLGWIPELAVCTDRPASGESEILTERFTSLESGLKPAFVFETDTSEIIRHLTKRWPGSNGRRYYDAFSPAFVVGSSLDRELAASLGAAHLSVSFPVTNRVVLDRGYTGYQGGLHLMEDLLGAIVATR
jgi:nitrogenase molybdenum-iron protein beta chain